MSGITGPKNLILAIDISGSMTGKMTSVKKVAQLLVSTMGYSD